MGPILNKLIDFDNWIETENGRKLSDFYYNFLCKENVITVDIIKEFEKLELTNDLTFFRKQFLLYLGKRVLENLHKELAKMAFQNVPFASKEMKCIAIHEKSLVFHQLDYFMYARYEGEDIIRIPAKEYACFFNPYQNIPTNIQKLISSIYENRSANSYIKVSPPDEMKDVHRFLCVYNNARNSFHNLEHVYFSLFKEKHIILENAVSFLNGSIRFFNRFVI